jgi:radical SAM superfamily enzyme YgiQ (UPF0313 family)
LINPSRVCFGVAVITPRWLYVLAAATGKTWGDPLIVDESLVRFDPTTVRKGDVVGIGIHTGNARRGYEIGAEVRARGAWVVYGGIHATLFPDEVHAMGSAHAVVKGDGDLIWQSVISDCLAGQPKLVYDGGRVSGDNFIPARWDLLPDVGYMAHGRPGTAAADGGRRRWRNRPVAAQGLQVHRARRRQFLPRAVRGSGRRGSARRQDALQRAEGNPPGTI